MADSIFAGLERLNNADLDKLTALIKKIIDDLEKAKKGQDDAAAKKKKEEEDAAKKKKEDCVCVGTGPADRKFWDDATRKHIKPVLDDIAKKTK